MEKTNSHFQGIAFGFNINWKPKARVFKTNSKEYFMYYENELTQYVVVMPVFDFTQALYMYSMISMSPILPISTLQTHQLLWNYSSFKKWSGLQFVI